MILKLVLADFHGMIAGDVVYEFRVGECELEHVVS